MAEPPWKRIKLSLERPYVDDNGERLPALLDITPEGQHIYEPREDWATNFGENFGRIFVERGIDFFESTKQDLLALDEPPLNHDIAIEDDNGLSPTESKAAGSHEEKHMTPEMLLKMRMEIMPRLHVALGEVSHARDLLSLLLSTSTSNVPSAIPSLPSGSLTSTTVSKLPDIISVQAFNAQLVTDGKDEALRKASSVLKAAAGSIERGVSLSETYWSDALKIRRGNWGLIPAPLPFGSATGKGADKTSKDFLISYGLEESPAPFLRRAVGQMSNVAEGLSDDASVMFPHKRNTRLRIILTKTGSDGKISTYYNHIRPETRETLDDVIKGAQREVVEQEIFAELIKEAGNLPTAAARVSERLIAIEAAQGVEIQFELLDSDLVDSSLSSSIGRKGEAICDLIYSAFHVLLLCTHAYNKSLRLGSAKSMRGTGIIRPPSSPLLLQPIIDLLQYQLFCVRIKDELSRMITALMNAGVHAILRFDPVGESGEQLVKSLVDDIKGKAGGEAILRVDDRQSIRFTFVSPSALTMHLPQATIPIASIPQLCQLLVDEVERGLLSRICEIGTEICENFNGTWFVDQMMYRSVGRWEGCVLNFLVVCADEFTVDCTANRYDRHGGRLTFTVINYSARENKALGLLSWVKHVIEDTMAR